MYVCVCLSILNTCEDYVYVGSRTVGGSRGLVFDLQYSLFQLGIIVFKNLMSCQNNLLFHLFVRPTNYDKVIDRNEVIN